MFVLSIISTKGGVGKTTTAANLGGFLADAGLRVLLLDLDSQPTLSSYYPLTHRAPGGSYELLAFNERDLARIVSRTTIPGLDVIVSNDGQGQLNTMLLHAPDGRLRLRHLLPAFESEYDVLLIDTQGARSVSLEMAILASNAAVSPVTPEILAARELYRGTLQVLEDIAPYQHLGIPAPPVYLLINRLPAVSSNAQQVLTALREIFSGSVQVHILDVTVPAIEAYPRAATQGVPVHRLEPRKPSGRLAPAALETQRQLAGALFSHWHARFAEVTGSPPHAAQR